MCYITWTPSRCFSFLYGFDKKKTKKNCNDAFLAGQVWHSLKLPQLQNLHFHQTCNHKTDGFLDLRCGDGLFFFLFSIDLLHLHCPRHNSPGVSAVIKGSSPQPLLKKQGLPTACKRIPALIPQAVVIKPPWNQDGGLKTGPLGSCHGGAPSPRRSCGWFVKTELDFKQSWDKYYLFFSKALISALEIVQPFNGSLSSVPYKDFV